jgi:hypothetical protein
MSSPFARRFIGVFLLVFGLLANASPETPKKILIITDSSGFKTKVINRIFKMSAGKGITYHVLDINDIVQSNSDKYDRYIILCKMVGGRIEEKSLAYYQTLSDKNAILIGLTYFFNVPMPENAKQEIGNIDAVTSASKNSNVDTFAKKIVSWIGTEN